jgi:hypothetical protein
LEIRAAREMILEGGADFFYSQPVAAFALPY